MNDEQGSIYIEKAVNFGQKWILLVKNTSQDDENYRHKHKQIDGCTRTELSKISQLIKNGGRIIC